MAKWSRQRAYTRGVCEVCGVREGTRLCDGVVARVPSWRLCNAAMCDQCTTRWGTADYCRVCGLVRGIIERDPGEEG